MSFDHPGTQCVIAGWCGGVGLLKYLDAVVIPDFIMWGTAIVVAWQLISIFLKGVRWVRGLLS